MPITISSGRYTFQSTNKNHSEELLFASGRFENGDIEVEMDAWPCTGERYHNCHDLFIRKSKNRIITVKVTADHAGYAANHGKPFGATGTITYNDGVVAYS